MGFAERVELPDEGGEVALRRESPDRRMVRKPTGYVRREDLPVDDGRGAVGFLERVELPDEGEEVTLQWESPDRRPVRRSTGFLRREDLPLYGEEDDARAVVGKGQLGSALVGSLQNLCF